MVSDTILCKYIKIINERTQKSNLSNVKVLTFIRETNRSTSKNTICTAKIDLE